MAAFGEFDLIREYFLRPELHFPLTAQHPLALGAGDDCAVFDVPAGHQLVTSVDTFVSGVHFFADMPADRVASRCLSASVSDLAAMGASPAWFTLCITLPTANLQFLQGFSDGLAATANQYGIALAGGDTTQGPLAISIQVMGLVPSGKAISRSSARVGDHLYVSGTLGDAGAGLAQVRGDRNACDTLAQRFYAPTARLELGKWLVSRASAAIDVSDGLLQDVGHILAASNVGATLACDRLPLSKALLAKYTADKAEQMALSAGEDFELCFSLPERHALQLDTFAQKQGLAVTRVGTITCGDGLTLTRNGQIIPTPSIQGWQHF